MKTKYKITIEETLSEEFEIEADNIHEALRMAQEDYKNGTLVLSPGELICKQICAAEEGGDYVDWYEF